MSPKHPQTPEALRIAALFHRKPTTPWTDKEIRRFRQLKKAGCFEDPAELEMIERYYAIERKKGSDGIHRRDLYTFLNNYSGELDRARVREKRLEGIRSKKPAREQPPQLTEAEIEANRQAIREQVESLKAKMRGPQNQKEEVPRIVKEALETFHGSLA